MSTFADDDDEPLFSDEGEEDASHVAAPALGWRVLVVDDDPDVLAMTALSLAGLHVDRAPVILVTATSAAQAQVAFAERGPFAAAIVDVIMETVTAGFDLVRWIREVHKDHAVRLVLRTGQPGDAQEARVMDQYDVHDYLGKAETSSRALNTSVIGAVRAWRDIRAVEEQAEGLRRTLAGLEALLQARTDGARLATVAAHVPQLLAPRAVSLAIVGAPDWRGVGARAAVVMVATGRYEPLIGIHADELLDLDSSGLPLFACGPLRMLLHVEGAPLNPGEYQRVEGFLRSAGLALGGA